MLFEQSYYDEKVHQSRVQKNQINWYEKFGWFALPILIIKNFNKSQLGYFFLNCWRKNNMNFYVLSEPIQAGKTTNLESWLKRKENNKEVWGIISPDRKGLRHFDAVSPLHSESIAVEVVQ